MKLLDISSFYTENGGGVRTYHHFKLDYFAKHPEHQYLMVISSEGDRYREKVRGGTVYRIPGFAIPRNESYRQISDVTGLRRIIAEERPDVIEIGSVYLDNWLIAATTIGKRPVKVGFYHADFPDSYLAPAVDHFPRAFSKRFLAFWHRYVQFAYDRLDATCVTSQYIEAKLERLGITNTVHIPLGVDTQLFHPGKRSNALRETLGIRSDETLLLYVGRFSTEKGIETMLKAMPSIARDKRRKIVLIGGGSIEDAVRRAAAPFDNVTVLDFINDQQWLSTLYASADLFLSPGPFETFGLSTLEALSSGVPVVVASCGGAYELVKETGGGEAFVANDPAAMADAVDRLLAGDASRIGLAAAGIVREKYSWEKTFDRMVSIYTALIDRKNRRRVSGLMPNPNPPAFRERTRLGAFPFCGA